MSGFKITSTNRDNPCFCGDTKGKCRITSSGAIFCHTYSDASLLEVINGYKCTKVADGHTATFMPDDSAEWTEENRKKWETENLRKKEQQEKELQKLIADQMAVTERDTHYRELREPLPLNQFHREHLQQRGYSDEAIDRIGFKSVTAWQKLNKKYPANLPGISTFDNAKFGESLRNPGSGIVYPVPDVDGKFTCLKFKPDDAEKFGKYRPISQKGIPVHLDGEQPLGVYRSPNIPEQPRAIALVESTDLKAFLAAEKLNLPTVGAGGGTFTASRNTATTTVEKLSQQYNTKRLEFYVDAGDAVNQKGVPARWMRQIKFFQELGYECLVAWWGQYTKAECDIDELEDLSVIGFITPDEFIQKCNSIGVNVEKLQKLNNQEKAKEEPSKTDWGFENWKSNLKFTPDIEVNQEYLDLPNLPNSGHIIAINSWLGTGKTQSYFGVMKSSENGAVILGNVNTVLVQVAKRAQDDFKLNIYHLKTEKEAHYFIGDESSRIAICPDSLHHLDGYFRGKDVIIDECCSVLKNLVEGGTLQDRQSFIMNIFNKMLQDCNNVYLYDGNLRDIEVTAIAAHVPDKKVLKVLNTYKTKPQTFKFLDVMSVEEEGEEAKVRKHDRSPVTEYLCNDQVKPWIFADSRGYLERTHKILSDHGKKGKVLHQLTVCEHWAEAEEGCLKKPDNFFTKELLDYFGHSPSANTGFSVTVEHLFTDKFSILVGVLGVNEAVQGMHRLRDRGHNLPHYVVCPEKSTIKNQNIPHNYTVQLFQKALLEACTLDGQLGASAAQDPTTAWERIQKGMSRQDKEWFEYACQIFAIDNYERDNYRRCLIHVLEERGNICEIIEWDSSGTYSKIEKETKEQLINEAAEREFKAVPYESLEDAKKAAKGNVNYEIQAKISKTYLLDKLPGIEQKDAWSKEFVKECVVKDKHFLSQLERFYLLENTHIAQKRCEAEWFYAATAETYFTAISKGRSHSLLWGLQQLQILERFVKSDVEWHKDSPEVVELWNQLESRKELQTALRITSLNKKADGKERTELLNKLLALIGVDVKAAGRKMTDEGVRLNHYKVNEETLNNPHRLAVLDCLAVRFEKWLSSDTVTKIQWSVDKPEVKIQQQTEATVFDNEFETIPSLQEIKEAELMETSKQRYATALISCSTPQEAYAVWHDKRFSQQLNDAAWQLLTVEQKDRFHNLYQLHQLQMA
jgi:hypothetical protein